MKEPLTALVGSIQKFSTEDGPGIRTTVFLKGCPLHCQWCHNPEMISPKQQLILRPSKCVGCGECVKKCPQHCNGIGEDGPYVDWRKCNQCLACTEVCYSGALAPVAKSMTAAEVMAVVEQDKDFYQRTGGGLTISGGEMLLHGPFVAELINIAKEQGITVCLDTSGYGDYETLHRLASSEMVVYILFDMKCIDDVKHRKYTGVSNALILEILTRLAADPLISPKLWMRMPLIKDVNDDWPTIEKTCEFFLQKKIHRVTLIAFHNMWYGKSRSIGKEPHKFATPSEEHITEIQNYMQKKGLLVDIHGGKTEKRQETSYE